MDWVVGGRGSFAVEGVGGCFKIGPQGNFLIFWIEFTGKR